MRILLVEDDPALGRGLKASLENQGFSVDWVGDGKTAELVGQQDGYVAMILDLGLPLQDGQTTITRLRQKGIVLPILVLTARDEIDDRLLALDGGADDYVVKPVDSRELAARIRALSRRLSGGVSPSINLRGVQLNPVRREVLQKNNFVSLTTREFDVLHVLMSQPGRVFTRSQIEKQILSWGKEVESNAIEVHIHHLRKKLGEEFIQTVRGVGYRCLND
jgi:DNA-binding response OmpR family regulator